MELASPPGQPLEARIPVEVVTAQELWALQAGVAPEVAFLRNGLDRSPELDSLIFEIVRDSEGGSLIRMTSPNPLASSMTVLVEATWLRRPDLPPGRLIRLYSFGPGDLPEAGAQPRPVGAGSLGTYGPVQEGETLWSLAERARAPAVHPNQALVALFEANPRGFGGNMNGIYQGATLRIPEAVQARRLTVEEATAEAVRQLDEWLAELEARGQAPLSSGLGDGADSIPGTERLQAELEGARQLLQTRAEELQTLQAELEEARAAAQAAEADAAEARAAAPPPVPPGLPGLWIELNRAASRALTAAVVVGLGVLLLFGMLIGFLLGRRGGVAREPGDAAQPSDAEPAAGRSPPTADSGSRSTVDRGTLPTADSGSLSTEDAAGTPEYHQSMGMESQLDLARAQLDMGDTAGARRSLRAVVKSGSKAQRRQAESLLREIEPSAKKEGSGAADDPG